MSRPRLAADIGVLDWNQRADELQASVCAPWGAGVAPAGLSKLWLGNRMAAARSLRVGGIRSRLPAGTLVSSTPHSLSVATADYDVVLAEFATLDGRMLNVAQLVRLSRVRDGMVLPSFPPAAAIDAAVQACDAADEAKWMDDLRHLKPAGYGLQGLPRRGTLVERTLVLPSFRGRLPSSVDAVEFSLAVLLGWLARLSGGCAFDIGLHVGRVGALPGANVLLARTRPFRVATNLHRDFDGFRQECAAQVVRWQARRPYLRDAVLRHPRLARPQGWPDFASWPIAVELQAAGGHCGAADPSSALTFCIGSPAGEVTLVHEGLGEPHLGRAASQLAAFAEAGLSRSHAPLGDLALLHRTEIRTLQEAVWGSPVS